MRLPLCSRRGDTLFAIDGRGHLSGNVGAARIAVNGSLNDAPLAVAAADIRLGVAGSSAAPRIAFALGQSAVRSEEQTSELQSLMRISYAVLCLKKHNEHIDEKTNKPTMS